MDRVPEVAEYADSPEGLLLCLCLHTTSPHCHLSSIPESGVTVTPTLLADCSPFPSFSRGGECTSFLADMGTGHMAFLVTGMGHQVEALPAVSWYGTALAPSLSTRQAHSGQGTA